MKETCVVIPARNEEILIGCLLKSIINAGMLPEDIYVIDDASFDGTQEEVKKVTGVNLLVNSENLGKASSLNRLIAHFKLLDTYTYIAFSDADSFIHPDYFHIALKRFADSGIVLVCGRNASPSYNWLTAYRGLEYRMHFWIHKEAQSKIGTITVAPGSASIFRAETLKVLQLESDTLSEDMDLTIQIYRKKLGRVVYEPRAIVYTQEPKTVRDYIKQINRWYTGTWQVIRKHNVPFGWQRIDAELLLIIGEGLFYGIMIWFLPFWFLLLPYLSGNLARYALGAIATQQAIFFIAAVIFAVIDRRWDFIKCFFLFPIPQFLNSGVFITSFWNTIIKKKKLAWLRVARYRIDR